MIGKSFTCKKYWKKKLTISIFVFLVGSTSFYHWNIYIKRYAEHKSQILEKTSETMTEGLETTTKSSLACSMSVNAIGRLGNLMGQYATLYSLAKLNNRTACILPEMSQVLGSYFQRLSLPILPDLMHFKWKHTYGLTEMMQENYKHLPKNSFINLTGFPNSWTFYHHFRKEILQEFQFKQEILDHVNRKLQLVVRGRENVTIVGVHVRRSDYVGLMKGHYRGVVANGEFFQQAMDYFNKKYNKTSFLVVSDDMAWCRSNINNSLGNVHFVGNNNITSPVYDLALMAHCNHSIIDIGSFGFWGAYLAGGETIYLTNYTLPDSSLLAFLDYSNAYLPEWIPIAADLSVALRKYKKNSPKANSLVKNVNGNYKH